MTCKYPPGTKHMRPGIRLNPATDKYWDGKRWVPAPAGGVSHNGVVFVRKA